jgi:SAM-dependent methyltransferase
LSKRTFVYTGCDNLEAMAEAKNYNNYLIELVEKATNQVNSKKPKILDFGAGSGTYADMLMKKGIKVDCLEPDLVLQKILKSKKYEVVADIKYLKPNTYDVIYSLNVFEHIKDDESVVELLKTALKPGGVLFVYVPAFQVLFSAMDRKVEHHRRYRKDRLRTFANKANLEILELSYCEPVGFAASLGYKILGSDDGVLSPGSVKVYDTFAFPISKFVQPITKHLFGKNVFMFARKKSE